MLILDVGCGHTPRGTVNVDLYTRRSGHFLRKDKFIRPKSTPNFVRADAHYLPFRNSIFPKVVTHHTLEHLDNPVKAIKEMLRVTKKTLEIVVPFWITEEIHLIFHPKKKVWFRKHHVNRFSKRHFHKIFKGFHCYTKYIYTPYHISLFVPIPDQIFCRVTKG